MTPSEVVPTLRVKVVGIGGAGCHILSRINLKYHDRIDLAAIDTDAQVLADIPIEQKHLLGGKMTHGLGSGGEVSLSCKAVEQDHEMLEALFADTELVFLIAGLGRGTGSGAGPAMAKISAKTDAFTIAFVALPFTFEGTQRRKQALESLAEWRTACHAVIPLPNDLLIQETEEAANVPQALKQADEWIRRGIDSCCTMLFSNSLIPLDFPTLRTAFGSRGGKTLFGLGRASGQDFIRKALDDLMLCPLLHLSESTRYADSLLVNIIGGKDLTLVQVKDLMHTLNDKFGGKKNTVIGAVVDPDLGDALELCVIGSSNIHENPTSQAVMNSDTPYPEKKPTIPAPTIQREFGFADVQKQRGYFDKTNRNLHDGEDLDIPTYLRKGIKIGL